MSGERGGDGALVRGARAGSPFAPQRLRLGNGRNLPRRFRRLFEPQAADEVPLPVVSLCVGS